MNKITVTTDNLAELRETIAIDQAKELHVGDETWGIIYQPSNQRGQMSRYQYNRGAIEMGCDSDWGDWKVAPDGTRYLILDETDGDGNQIGFDEDGNHLDTDDDGIISMSKI